MALSGNIDSSALGALPGKDHAFSAAEVGEGTGLTAKPVERVFRDIDAKRRVARYLHASPALASGYEERVECRNSGVA